ncbi:MAG: hypothetical protein H7210_13965, partial [Pyrinomonadaceae bacterium]|nr:hypothetical protein [Phycisphaerales bacterium]
MSVWKDYVGASDEQDTRRRRLHDDEKGERADRRRALFESAAAAVVFLAVGTLLGAGLLSTATATLRDEKSHELVRLASAATSTIDGDLHKTLTDPSMIDGPVYNRAIAALKQMARATPDIKYMYTAVLDGADIRLVLDAAEPGDNDNDGLEDRSGVWELYNDADPSMLHALGDGTIPGEATCTGQTYTDKWGTFIGGYAPIFDSNGVQVGVVGVDMDAAGYLANLADSRNHILYGAIPAVILSLGAAMSWCVLRLRLLRTDRMLTSTLAGDRDLAMTLAREMTADLAAAKEEAEAGSRAKSQFLANMSHEIRTPLTAILGYADLLHEEGDLASAPASRIRNLNTIRSAGQHLMSVINNILDLSKIEADKMIVHRTETPLMDILTEVQSFMRSRAKEKGITLCMDLQTPVPDRIISEPTHLRQIIT